MRHAQFGAAAVLVYQDGRRAHTLVHPHDGGEAYMGPLLRKALAYAKVQYRSGDISQILLAEEAMEKVTAEDCNAYLSKCAVRHVYYLTSAWDRESGKKTYHVYAQHLKSGEGLVAGNFPDFAKEIPESAERLV